MGGREDTPGSCWFTWPPAAQASLLIFPYPLCGMLQHSHWQSSHLFQKEPPPGRKRSAMWQPGRLSLIKQTAPLQARVCLSDGTHPPRGLYVHIGNYLLEMSCGCCFLRHRHPSDFLDSACNRHSGLRRENEALWGCLLARWSQETWAVRPGPSARLTRQEGPCAKPWKCPVMHPFKNIQDLQGKEHHCILLSIQEFSWLASDSS